MIGVSMAQCRHYTKKQCLPDLAPYIFNGQLNSAKLMEGEFAELVLSLHANMEYRILVCGQENIGQLEYKIYDANNNELYYNKDYDYVNYWDFKSASTQQLIIKIKVPENQDRAPGAIKQTGCVAILVGFKND